MTSVAVDVHPRGRRLGAVTFCSVQASSGENVGKAKSKIGHFVYIADMSHMHEFSEAFCSCNPQEILLNK